MGMSIAIGGVDHIIRTYEELAATGHSKRDVASMIGDELLERVGAGVFIAPPLGTDFPSHLHLARSAAFVHKTSARWTLSHWSAAIAHGLPDWGLPLDRIAVTRNGPTARTTSTSNVRRRTTVLDEVEITRIGDLAVTSLPRTLFDVATTCGHAASVVAIEAALAEGARRTRRRAILAEDPELGDGGADTAEPISKRALSAYFRTHARRKNLPAALAALDFASPLSESPLESRSRLFLAYHGFPMPEQQVEICTRDGNRYRVDFLWGESRLIGEADGAAKVLGGSEAAKRRNLGDLWRREEDLRAEGYRFVRWGWPNLEKPMELKARIDRAMAGAAVDARSARAS